MSDRLMVFDIGNVLLRFDTRLAAAAFDRHDPGKGEALAASLWAPPLMNRFETGKISGEDLFSRVKKSHDLKMSFAQFRRAFVDIFDPIRENVALFNSFVARGPVALLSNVNEIHWAFIMRRYPFLKKAHHPLGSHRIGAMKPSRKAYQAVAEKTGFPYRKMVYVDDRPEFIEAARRLGLTSIHFTGKRPLKKLLAEAGIV